jgi:hypothetical protein
MMGLRLLHLGEPDVREAMVLHWSAEWSQLVDRPDRRECYGKALTDEGWDVFGDVMPEALAEHDDDWLYDRMDHAAYWVTRLPRRGRGGHGWTTYAVNRPEHLRRLCLGEFNVAYVRGLAQALLQRGETHAEIYRAGDAVEPRSECSSWEGSPVPLQQIIGGHRARYWPPPGDPGAWSLPTGVNCHHSIRVVPRHSAAAVGERA